MSNKIALATIQFRADAKGANAALESMRQSADDARKRVKELQEALDKGIKTMKDTNGVEFKVSDAIRQATKDAKGFESALRELMKGATALETVVKNIRLGEIEASSRAELKGAINAAESRKRSVRGTDPESIKLQRDLNTVIEESRKQLNNLDRDTAKVIETIQQGGNISQAVLDKEQKGLREMLTLIPKGTDEWKQYSAQLQQIEAHVANIRQQEQQAATALLGSKDLGKYSENEIRAAINSAKELLATYKTTSPEAKALADNIIRAEQHLKDYGLEAARAAAREQQQLQTERELATTMRKRLTDLKSLSADALVETRKYWEAQRNGAAQGTVEFTKAEAALKKIDNLQIKQKVGVLDSILGDPSKHGVGEVRQAVQEMEKLRDSVQQGVPVWQHYNKMVNEGKLYLDNLAKTEAAQRISQQMQQLSTLSISGLQEVKKYWETMVAGAAHGSTELDTYKAKLEQVMAEENTRATAKAQQSASNLGGNLNNLSESEIRQAIEAGKQLIQTYKTADPAAQQLAKNIVAAEEHLKQYGLEAERAAQREADALQKVAKQRAENDALMQTQLQQGIALTQTDLRQQEQYWQRLIDDPKTAAANLQTYKDNLATVHQLQAELTKTQNVEWADKLLGGRYLTLSEADLRKAITAAREYQQTFSPTEGMYRTLSQQIVKAEEHLRQFGIEAERTAQKEINAERKAADERAKLNTLMETQLERNTGLSQSALKAQENYWQRLIDDPKAASHELARYYENLNKVRAIQKEQEESQVKAKGISALNRFRSDLDYENKVSADQLKEDTDALKAYRNSLPQEGNVSLIRELDYYIGLTGKSAEKAAQQTMSLADAERLAGQLGTKGFSASTDNLKLAKKALEDAQSAAGRGTARFTELQAAINKIDLELSKTGQLTKEVQAVLDQPKGRSFNALKQAVEQGRTALQSMDRTTVEGQKAFDELAKKVKAADIEMKQLGSSSKGTASAFDKAWSRLKTYVGLYVGAAVAMQKLAQTMGDLMELSDKMGEVRKTTGFSADEVGRLSDNLSKLDTRTPLTQLMELSSLAGSVGLKTQQDVQGFTEAANQLIVALPEMGNESARTLIKIATATGDLEKNNNDVRETLEKVGSTIIALRANSASAAGPITDFVSRVGAVGAQAGISIDQIAALGSTIDALGGRVEMSATALSRMIPAIRNNSFAIANSIGVTEKYLKSLAPMQQMVLIFQKMRDNIQHIDTSTEEGMNAMADNVEAMLGKNATMREVMKDLEQQGARAGIVFGLLSQNVGELQRQLGIASDAYEKNTALMNEYNNMNETAAAKWERLKNAMEEWFVKDSWQRTLGAIIDGLRRIVDLLSGDNTINSFFRGVLVYLALLKGKWTQTIGSALISTGKFILSMRASTIAAEANTAAQTTNAVAITATGNAAAETTAKTNLFAKAWGKMNAAMKANVITALAGLLIWLGKTLWDSHKAAQAAEEAYARLNQQINEEKAAVDRLFRPLKNANLEHAEKVRLINAINSQYGSYLGKMLTEASNAHEIERAYRAINMQLEKKSLLEGIEANKKRMQEQQSGQLDSAFSEMDKAVAKASKTTTDASAISAFIAGAVKDALEQGLSPEQMRKNIQSQLKKEISEGTMKEYVQIISGGMSRREESDRYIAHAAVLYYNAQKKVQDDATEANKRLQADLDNLISKTQKIADKDIPELIADYNKALSKGNDASKYTAKESSAVVEAFNAIKAYYDLHHDELSDEQKKRINAALKLDISNFQTKANTDNSVHGPNPSPNPYGTYNRITDSYDKWDADTLVNRRKEMLERVRALANGADVQAVLSEDAKFISEATRKNIKTTRDAIEWYNTERLKIQDALHEKHLTNTGDWMDPTGRRKRARMLKDEWSSYLNEIDAYYTERKAAIQEQQNDEEISEAEAWRRTLANEAEWRQRRAELQKLYARKSGEVTAEEQQALFDIISERTGDSAKFIQATIGKTVQFIYDIGKHSEAEMRNIFGKLDKGIEQDYLRQRNAVGKQMDAIRDIIEKERPFNGITENLEQNLTKMGVLYGDMDDELERLRKAGEDVSEFNAKQREEGLRRMAFLLQEAEHAYNTNIEEVMQRMAEKGMTVWAEYLRKSPKAQDALMAQLHTTFDKVQEAIKKEASLWKKEAENMWNNILLPDGQTTLKQLADRTVAALSLDESRTKRANSLINAGQASERVADRLAIQQMKVQLAMQEHYYNIMRQRGQATIDDMERQAAAARERHDIEAATRFELEAQHARMTLNLATTKEETELAKQREEIIARTEESQNRLYTELKAWADLISSSLQNVFEASHAGDAEYYNERAKLNLTGKGGPGAGTYIVIEDEGTSDASAHYEYLNEREALERQREIENQNALAEAWRKLMDDINMKLSETITDQLNAMLQNQSIDANTQAVIANTEALYETAGGSGRTAAYGETKNEGRWTINEGRWTKNEGTVAAGGNGRTAAYGEGGEEWLSPIAPQGGEPGADYMAPWTEWAEQSSKATETMVGNNKKVEQSTQSAFARMTMAANMYGIAYQAMSNENLNTTQKFSMMALQAVGNYAIGALTAEMASASAKAATDSPGVLGTLWKQLGWAAAPVFAIFTGLLGGLMGLATSKITKAKGQIAQVTGAGHVSAGRLSTGMLQYAEGNVNEFTDPSSLREGQTYQVDAANGKTYKARYMGKGAKTHITNGPEFHLVGEEGREAIIDAKTTRHIRFNEPEVWRYIQTLYNGGSLSHLPRRRGRGVAAFADGNLDEMGSGGTAAYGESGLSPEQVMAMQASLDRNSEVLERALTEGIKGVFDVYGKGGLVDSYDTGKKTVKRHGERY